MSWSDPCSKCNNTRADCSCVIVKNKEIIYPTDTQISEFINDINSWVSEEPKELMKITANFVVGFIKQANPEK